MLQFIKDGGPFMILILIISFGMLILIIKKVIDLYIKKKEISINDDYAINSILFWGCICALLGILGQLTGIYLAVTIIAKVQDISPQIILMGFGQSFTTSIIGLWILLISSTIWFVLKGKYKKLINSK